MIKKAVTRLVRRITWNIPLKPGAQTEFQGDMAVRGMLEMLQLATPSAPTVTYTGAAGAGTRYVKVVALCNGGKSVASAAGSVANCHATWDATKYITVTWSRIAGATGYEIWTSTDNVTYVLETTITSGNTLSVDVTDGTGDAGTPSTVNTTGNAIVNHSVRAHASGAQAINATSWAKITLDVEDYDPGSHFATSTYTVAKAGKYLVTAAVIVPNTWDAVGGKVAIYKNGAAYSQTESAAYQGRSMVISDIVDCAVNDTIELYAYNANAGSRSTTADTTGNFMAVQLLS